MEENPVPRWEEVDTVLLDLDGTLLDLAFDNRFWRELVPRQLAARRGTDFASAWRMLAPMFEATRGTLDWYCLEYWSRELGLDLEALTRAVRHEIAWLPHARDFLDRLRSSGRRLVLVTNAHPHTLRVKDAHLNLRRQFDAVFSSHEFGAAKEQQGFWSRLAAADPFECGRALLVDDSLPVLRAARDHGVGQLWAVRRPDSREPCRPASGFASVESVRQPALTLADAPQD